MIRPHDIEDSDEDEEDEPHSDYQWCLHCERAFRRGENRRIHGLRTCPYEGCDGSIELDGWDWDEFRSNLPQYPPIPVMGVNYPMYPEDYPVLSKDAERILVFLVSEIRRGRFDPAKDSTLCSHKEVLEALGFPKFLRKWESCLNARGLHLLALWARTHKLPALTGLIVNTKKPRLPDDGYFKTYKVTADREEWWRTQIREALAFDWSPWLPPSE